jgi:hypothetical protein
MPWPRVTPQSPQRAGDAPGDRSGLSRTPRDPARGRPAAASLRGARTAPACGSSPRILDMGSRSQCNRVAGPVSPSSPPFNPHTVAPAPRSCPIDL